jgi:hypothetical protein
VQCVKLINAAIEGHTEVAKVLVEGGANANAALMWVADWDIESKDMRQRIVRGRLRNALLPEYGDTQRETTECFAFKLLPTNWAEYYEYYHVASDMDELNRDPLLPRRMHEGLKKIRAAVGRKKKERVARAWLYKCSWMSAPISMLGTTKAAPRCTMPSATIALR